VKSVLRKEKRMHGGNDCWKDFKTGMKERELQMIREEMQPTEQK